MLITLYKRNAKGEPIFWSVEKTLEDREEELFLSIVKASFHQKRKTISQIQVNTFFTAIFLIAFLKTVSLKTEKNN